MKDRKNFSGGAAMYLKELTEDLISNVEQCFKLKNPNRYLPGISGSVSGSLWFDGFAEWAHKTPFFGNARLYLSRGPELRQGFRGSSLFKPVGRGFLAA